LLKIMKLTILPITMDITASFQPEALPTLLQNARERALDIRDMAVDLSGQAAARGLDAVLQRGIRHGGLEVTFPQGHTETYGDAEPELGMTLRTYKVLGRLLVQPSLAVGEGYAFGDMDFTDPHNPEAAVPPIDKFVQFMAQNYASLPSWYDRFAHLRDAFGRKPNDPASHYDISNDFYKLWLDKSMTYSCAYWDEKPETMTLEEAQDRKIEHILRKLQLEQSMHILDIGSGWGNLLITAAQEHGVTGLGVTLSKEQLAGSQQAAEDAGVEHLVEFRLMNYRDLAADAAEWSEPERFDRVVSVGMYEHIGRGNQKQYFDALNTLLKQGGITLLHTIAQEHDKRINRLVDEHVFPGGNLPTLAIVASAAEKAGLRDPDVESLRQHYAYTLDQWWARFEENLPAVRELFEAGKIKHRTMTDPESFVRLWRFYLATSSGAFRYNNLDLLQCVFTKGLNNDKQLTREHIYAA
jgi:cyclopropane-fatty-acyl-phospholipid synthase